MYDDWCCESGETCPTDSNVAYSCRLGDRARELWCDDGSLGSRGPIAPKIAHCQRGGVAAWWNNDELLEDDALFVPRCFSQTGDTHCLARPELAHCSCSGLAFLEQVER